MMARAVGSFTRQMGSFRAARAGGHREHVERRQAETPETRGKPLQGVLNPRQRRANVGPASCDVSICGTDSPTARAAYLRAT